LDYQGTALVNERWPRTVDGHAVHSNKDKQTEFFAWCNLANTIGTLLLSNLGFRKLVDRGGLVLTLLACPVAMLTSVLVVCVYRDFWTVQVVLVVVNTIQYALSGPSREMLYIQTSKDVKYKAKSWSDMYGNFIQKTIGAELNLHVNREMASCTPHCFKPVFTGVYTIVWCSVWAIIATQLGKMHARLVKNNKIIS
jgi:ATP/ADP translocase